MFQDEQTKYLIIGPALALFLTALGGVYEIAAQDHGTALKTVVAIVRWSSTAVALTITILALWRAYEMIAKERYREEGRQEGREEGERKGIIESILSFLGARFNPDAVQALKPALESIDDLPRLKELLLSTSHAESLEAFMQTLRR